MNEPEIASTRIETAVTRMAMTGVRKRVVHVRQRVRQLAMIAHGEEQSRAGRHRGAKYPGAGNDGDDRDHDRARGTHEQQRNVGERTLGHREVRQRAHANYLDQRVQHDDAGDREQDRERHRASRVADFARQHRGAVEPHERVGRQQQRGR